MPLLALSIDTPAPWPAVIVLPDSVTPLLPTNETPPSRPPPVTVLLTTSVLPLTPDNSIPAAPADSRCELLTVLPLNVMLAPASLTPSSPWPSIRLPVITLPVDSVSAKRMPSLLLSSSRLPLIWLLSAAPMTVIAPTPPLTDSLLPVRTLSMIRLLSPPPVRPSIRMATPVVALLPCVKLRISKPRSVLPLASSAKAFASAPADEPSITIVGAPSA